MRREDHVPQQYYVVKDRNTGQCALALNNIPPGKVVLAGPYPSEPLARQKANSICQTLGAVWQCTPG